MKASARAGLALAVLAGLAQAGNTCTYSNGWDILPSGSSDAIIIAASNLTWSASMPSNVASWTQQAGYTNTVTFQTVYGASGFTNFTVNGNVTIGGGAWTHGGNGGSEANRLRVTVGGNLLITNATISADALGYGTGQGFGTTASYWQGGAHGGAARGSLPDGNVNIYGSIFAPTNLGSGGGGAGGGGAILLAVAGTTTVAAAGSISANGVNTTVGTGAGGSVYLTTGWLTGSGTIQANGGISSGSGAGGGGGRVALILTGTGADFSQWNGTNTAYGGTPATAAAGTVYRRTQSGVDTLIIDNNGNGTDSGKICTPMPSAANLNNFSNVVINHKGILGVRGDTTLNLNTFNPAIYGSSQSYLSIDSDTNVTYPATWVIDGYTVYVNRITKTPTHVTIGTNGVLSHYFNAAADSYKVNLSISGNLTVLSNGIITADGLGYSNVTGPGKGSPAWGDGASYGGCGQLAAGVNASTYGSILTPTNVGSGGGGGGANGGGAIVLSVAKTTTVFAAGSITANGQCPSTSGAGSGGSVFLTTGWLTGGGTIQGNGGASTGSGNGGGGGRVAIVLTGAGADFSTWTGSNTAYGGATGKSGAAGTVYRLAAGTTPGAGTIIVNNGATGTNAAFTPLPAFSNSTENIGKTLWMSTNYARLGLVASTNIASLTLNTNGFLELSGNILTVKALTVTNKVYKSGTYGPHDTSISALTDSGSGGKVIVNAGMKGTTVWLR